MDTAPHVALLRRHRPGLDIRAVAPILDGWDSVVLEVNGELIFRFPRRPDVEQQYEKELLLLPHLTKLLPAPVPLVEYVGREGGTIRFFGYRKIEGVPLAKALSAGLDEGRVVASLADFLSHLHHIEPASFPVELAAKLGRSDDASAWRQWYRDFYRRIREHVLPLTDAGTWERIETTWEDFLGDDANFCFRPALIHADFASEHILCDPVGGRLVGVIDWGDAMLGDPALDFAGLLCQCGETFAERVLARYQGEVDATFRRRVRFYERIIPLHSVTFALTTGDEERLRGGLEFLRWRFPG